MIIERLVLTSAESNCFVVGCERTRQALVVDPGDQADRILETAAQRDLQVALVVITHAHWDHVNAAGPIARRTGAPVGMHPADLPLLALTPEITRDRTGVRGPEPPPIDRPLADGGQVRVGDVWLEVLHTPGHTPGSICLAGQGVVFTGDTLMAGWLGRTDRAGGDQQALRSSVWDRLLRLPPATRVYAGHLEPTSIAVELRDNPYVTGRLPLR